MGEGRDDAVLLEDNVGGAGGGTTLIEGKIADSIVTMETPEIRGVATGADC